MGLGSQDPGAKADAGGPIINVWLLPEGIRHILRAHRDDARKQHTHKALELLV